VECGEGRGWQGKVWAYYDTKMKMVSVS